ncbi:MAG: hypothetical protein U1E59_06755 [Amaricoccus sp.]
MAMGTGALLPLAVAMAIAGAVQASAQDLAPVAAAPAEAAAPAGFTSSAQARTYLAQNPTGARAEQAFRAIVNGDLAVQNPELDPAQIASGWALKVMPGATVSPEQVEAVINTTTTGIGAKKGWF